MRAEALAAVEIWSFQERSDSRVKPSIEILSLNSGELEPNDMSANSLHFCAGLLFLIDKYLLDFHF